MSAAKKGVRLSACGSCETGTYIATGFGTAICDKDSSHVTTSYRGDFILARKPSSGPRRAQEADANAPRSPKERDRDAIIDAAFAEDPDL